MKIKDFALYMPRWLYSTSAKHIRTKIPELTKEYIQDNHLYHITGSEETAENIIQSGYLKPATGIMKYINSYGSPVACMFAGMPSADNYIKNLTDTNIERNPYINPTMIASAIEIDIQSKELEKYKTRLFSDGVIVYKGKCNLPENRVKKVQLVPDLCINEKTGEKTVKFRKRTEKEIKESPEEYKPSQDYLKYILEKKKKLGYTNSKVNNLINTVLHEQKIESEMTTKNIKYNFLDKIKWRVKNLFQKKLPVSNSKGVVKSLASNEYKEFRNSNKFTGNLENTTKTNSYKEDINKEDREL